jgi:hypothetical protein
MWGDSMTQSAVAASTDTELVSRFREKTIERAKSRFLPAGNRIYDREMTPIYNALAARGTQSLRSLLSLLGDASPDVRLDAAALVYHLGPERCREVLRGLLKEKWLRPIALLLLCEKEPAVASQFSRLANEQNHEAVEHTIDEFAERDQRL